jgi:hypothetical protein
MREPNATPPMKPSWRGWQHAAVFPVALITGLALVATAPTSAGRVSSAIFATTALLLFGVSALLHRGSWSTRFEATLRRLDHANIYLIIAGPTHRSPCLRCHRARENCCYPSFGRVRLLASCSRCSGLAYLDGCPHRFMLWLGVSSCSSCRSWSMKQAWEWSPLSPPVVSSTRSAQPSMPPSGPNPSEHTFGFHARRA